MSSLSDFINEFEKYTFFDIDVQYDKDGFDWQGVHKNGTSYNWQGFDQNHYNNNCLSSRGYYNNGVNNHQL